MRVMKREQDYAVEYGLKKEDTKASPDIMRSAALASKPSEEGPPLPFSSSSGGVAWAAGGAPEVDEPSSLPPADAATDG
ncbi:hypothetical protein JG687_00017528 [Phytophthora cactorum]|uniref:Uncharacterized protein n=1 Tax=Phytophthora cactorum TaxID=29920 RepID=A0A8T1TRB1_9STRA|nr:hypothetical protein GQ600_11093 [Phytophthora cactorum]KAG6945020.1 hypothetical protein JG687_00017528 [Phytophthora cactorum]